MHTSSSVMLQRAAVKIGYPDHPNKMKASSKVITYSDWRYQCSRTSMRKKMKCLYSCELVLAQVGTLLFHSLTGVKKTIFSNFGKIDEESFLHGMSPRPVIVVYLLEHLHPHPCQHKYQHCFTLCMFPGTCQRNNMNSCINQSWMTNICCSPLSLRNGCPSNSWTQTWSP